MHPSSTGSPSTPSALPISGSIHCKKQVNLYRSGHLTSLTGFPSAGPNLHSPERERDRERGSDSETQRQRERDRQRQRERETESRLGEGLNELNLFLSEQKKRFSRSITALNSVESVTSLLKSIYLYFWYNGFALCCSVQFSSHSFDI